MHGRWMGLVGIGVVALLAGACSRGVEAPPGPAATAATAATATTQRAVTGTTRPPGDKELFCEVARNNEAILTNDDIEEDQAVLSDLVDVLRALQRVAPPEIAPDLDVMVRELDQLARLPSGQFEERANELLEDPEVDRAGKAVGRYLTDECDVRVTGPASTGTTARSGSTTTRRATTSSTSRLDSLRDHIASRQSTEVSDKVQGLEIETQRDDATVTVSSDGLSATEAVAVCDAALDWSGQTYSGQVKVEVQDRTGSPQAQGASGDTSCTAV